MRDRLFTFVCRSCAATVVQSGGRRRRFCGDCLRRLQIRMRRQKQERFMRRPAGTRRAG